MSARDSELFQSGLEPMQDNKQLQNESGKKTHGVAPVTPPPDRRRRGSSRMAAPIGLVVLLLCGIGIITVIVVIVNVTRSFINNDKEKARFERLLMPVVMYDPPPFEDVKNLDQAALLQTAMWSAILNSDDAKWAKDELNFSQIPASELDVRAANLFGPGVKLEHQTFGDYEITYYYDEATKIYSVPPTAEVALYTPTVVKITKEGDSVSLRVGYVPPGSVWEIDENGNRFQPQPDKFMKYILKKTETGYIIVALRDVEQESSSSGYANTSSYAEELINSGSTSSVGETFGDDSTAAAEDDYGMIGASGDEDADESGEESSSDAETSSEESASGESPSSSSSASSRSSSSASSSSRSSSASSSSRASSSR